MIPKFNPCSAVYGYNANEGMRNKRSRDWLVGIGNKRGGVVICRECNKWKK